LESVDAEASGSLLESSTTWEIQFIEQLGEGLTVKEIAAKLQVSRARAVFHLGNIYQKLEVQP